MSMKFLTEGRKEDLLQKYMDEFDISVLDTILNDSFTKSTNYKYADWILNNLEFNSTPLALEVLELVKKFDRIGKNLEIKDLNQYPDVVELRHAVENYVSKSQEKKIESEAKKIYEDSRVLIVKPLSHKASCKYGAGTKWCTTESSPGYFEKYTFGNDSLYYIMMKEFDISNKFYKIALHKSFSTEIWYDSKDTALPPREVEILKVGLGKKAIENIENDYSKETNDEISKLFDSKNVFSKVVEYNVLESNKNLFFEFKNPNIVQSNHAEIEFIMSLIDENESETRIENGNLKVIFKPNEYHNLFLEFGFEPGEFEPPVEISRLYSIDFHISNFNFRSREPFENLCDLISDIIWRNIKYDEELQKYIAGFKKVWQPNKNYGFTFKRKGLINQLVKYVDEGNEGNALDFLIDIGKIKKFVDDDGTVRYASKRGYISPKGYFSAFFASAVKAGIISYQRRFKKNILSKGKNFEAFKEGNLVPGY